MKHPPDDCIDCFRGVRRKDLLFGEGTDISVFAPDKDKPVRDGWLGASINWNLTDGGALDELRGRKDKQGETQFKGGAVQLLREEINSIIKHYGAENFGYEWTEEGGNIYHGHLLFSNTLIKERRSAIYGALSYIAKRLE